MQSQTSVGMWKDSAAGGRESIANGGDMVRQFAVVFVTILTLIMNWAATSLPLNGLSTEMISDSNPTLFTPAGYVFSIWGVIYLGVLAYTIFQALPSQRANPRLRAIGWIYVVSGLLNSLWILLWHNLLFWWCALVIAGMVVSLILITQRLYPSRLGVSRVEWWTSHLPFSIYLGWICVATIANISIALTASGWNGVPLSPEMWTVIMLAIASLLGFFFGFVRQNAGYVLVLAWAFAGIAVARQGESTTVLWTAALLSVVMTVVAVRALVVQRQSTIVAR